MEPKGESPNTESNTDSDKAVAKLNSERADLALKWLKEKWKTPQTCPICTASNWTVGHVWEIRPYRGGNLHLGDGVFPLSPISCLNCGYTFFMNGIINKALEVPSNKPVQIGDEK